MNQRQTMASLGDNPVSGGKAAKGPPKPPRPPKPAEKADAQPQAAGVFGSGLRVSLIPSEEEGKGAGLRRGILIVAFVVVIEALAFGGFYVYLLQSETARKAELDELMSRRAAVSAEIDAAADDLSKVSGFLKQVDAVVDVLDGHLRWTEFFGTLEDLTLPNVRYLSFSGDAASGTVSLTAVARSYRDVAEQVVLLGDDPRVRSVTTRSATAKVDELGNVVGVTFSLVLEMENDVWFRAVE